MTPRQCRGAWRQLPLLPPCSIRPALKKGFRIVNSHYREITSDSKVFFLLKWWYKSFSSFSISQFNFSAWFIRTDSQFFFKPLVNSISPITYRLVNFSYHICSCEITLPSPSLNTLPSTPISYPLEVPRGIFMLPNLLIKWSLLGVLLGTGHLQYLSKTSILKPSSYFLRMRSEVDVIFKSQLCFPCDIGVCQ